MHAPLRQPANEPLLFLPKGHLYCATLCGAPPEMTTGLKLFRGGRLLGESFWDFESRGHLRRAEAIHPPTFFFTLVYLFHIQRSHFPGGLHIKQGRVSAERVVVLMEKQIIEEEKEQYGTGTYFSIYSSTFLQ